MDGHTERGTGRHTAGRQEARWQKGRRQKARRLGHTDSALAVTSAKRTMFVHGRTVRRARASAVVAFLGLLALLGGCGAGSDDAAETSSADMGSGDARAPGADGGGLIGDAGGEAEAPQEPSDVDAAAEEEGDGATTDPVTARTGRRIVRTAQLELQVEDGGEAADEVAAIATRKGGFVAETDLQRDPDGVVRGSITLRVPSEELFATVEELDALAVSVPVRRIDEQDVTAESTDLQARLTNLRSYETELRTLLADVRGATTRPDDLLTIFERIRSVRAEIDQAEARLAVLDDAVALSTVHVDLQPAASARPVVDPGWSPSETVRDALTATARALSGIADATIRFVLTVLPIGLILVAPIVAVVLVWRRVRPGRSRPSTTEPPEASATS